MRINIAPILLDHNNQPLRQPEPPNDAWTIGLVLQTCILAAPPAGTSYTEAQQVGRYALSQDLHEQMQTLTSGMTSAFVDLSVEQAVELKADVVRMFGPIIAGQMVPILNGNQVSTH